MPRFVLTGAPGTGKTTVLTLLSRSYATVPEPAREVISEHTASTGERTLDDRPALFVEKLVERSMRDHEAASDTGVTIFDRGLPDCAAYAVVFGLDAGPVLEIATRNESPVFMIRPWREIYTTDELRQATFEQVEAFHTGLVDVYNRLGYETIDVPNTNPEERADFIRGQLSQLAGG